MEMKEVAFMIQSASQAGKSERRPIRKREERSAGETIRRVRARKRRRTIVLTSSIAVTVIAVIIVAIIINSSPTVPGTLVVHIYDMALYQPPCPSPVSTLSVRVTVTLNGPHSATTPNVLGLVAYQDAPPGSYQVTATASGYTQASQNATVTSGNIIHVCLALSKV